jgi:hypothetical protein
VFLGLRFSRKSCTIGRGANRASLTIFLIRVESLNGRSEMTKGQAPSDDAKAEISNRERGRWRNNRAKNSHQPPDDENTRYKVSREPGHRKDFSQCMRQSATPSIAVRWEGIADSSRKVIITCHKAIDESAGGGKAEHGLGDEGARQAASILGRPAGSSVRGALRNERPYREHR